MTVPLDLIEVLALVLAGVAVAWLFLCYLKIVPEKQRRWTYLATIGLIPLLVGLVLGRKQAPPQPSIDPPITPDLKVDKPSRVEVERADRVLERIAEEVKAIEEPETDQPPSLDEPDPDVVAFLREG